MIFAEIGRSTKTHLRDAERKCEQDISSPEDRCEDPTEDRKEGKPLLRRWASSSNMGGFFDLPAPKNKEPHLRSSEME